MRERVSRMLTASRAWVRTSHAHSQGFGGGGGGGGGSLGHIGRCQKAHRRKLLMCSEGVKRDAGLWYSRKRKKRGGHLQEAEEGGGGSGAEEGEMTGKVERGVCPDMASSLSVCSDCGTSRTPLWRRGPAGPKVIISVLHAIALDLSCFFMDIDPMDSLCSLSATLAELGTGRRRDTGRRRRQRSLISEEMTAAAGRRPRRLRRPRHRRDQLS